jgi:myo-inositol-1(or 4)-monophosphatase
MHVRELEELLHVAAEAARLGGRVLLDWRSRFSVQTKGRNDFLTDADLASQEAVQSFLAARCPDLGFLGEESRKGDDFEPPRCLQPLWVVDPLDGTTNYVHGIPVFAVSIGLVVAHEPVLGAIYDPSRDELFHGARGVGAWLGGDRLQTSSTCRLADALLSSGFPPDLTGQEHTLEVWRHLSLHARSLRRTGCTSLNLAYVAAGRHDGFWTHQAWPWDAAAGAALVCSAGGSVTNLDGSDYDLWTLDIVASNDPLHSELLNGLRAGLGSARRPRG